MVTVQVDVGSLAVGPAMFEGATKVFVGVVRVGDGAVESVREV